MNVTIHHSTPKYRGTERWQLRVPDYRLHDLRVAYRGMRRGGVNANIARGTVCRLAGLAGELVDLHEEQAA